MFSRICLKCGKSDTGLYLENMCLFPDLNTGITFATFILYGNTPDSNDILQF